MCSLRVEPPIAAARLRYIQHELQADPGDLRLEPGSAGGAVVGGGRGRGMVKSVDTLRRDGALLGLGLGRLLSVRC